MDSCTIDQFTRRFGSDNTLLGSDCWDRGFVGYLSGHLPRKKTKGGKENTAKTPFSYFGLDKTGKRAFLVFIFLISVFSASFKDLRRASLPSA